MYNTYKSDVTYRDGCWNCRWLFMKHEYDSGSSFFCALGAPERPPCGSVAMDECGDVFADSKEQKRERWDKWGDWAEGREIWPKRCPICEKFEREIDGQI